MNHSIQVTVFGTAGKRLDRLSRANASLQACGVPAEQRQRHSVIMPPSATSVMPVV